MPNALVIEDGSVVQAANSYATLDQVRSFNTLRGVSLPDADDAVIALAIEAMDYLATFESRLAGERVAGFNQPLAWPRKFVRAYSLSVPINIVPFDIVGTQCYLAGIAQDVDLYGNKDNNTIIQSTIGPLTDKYAPNKGATAGPILPTVTAMLRPYFKAGSGALQSVRL